MQRIPRSELERIAEKLAAAPVPDKVVSKYEAIGMLEKSITRMRKRGYSLKAVADVLAAQQLPIGVGTLKTYLHRLKKRRRTAKAAESPQMEHQPQVTRPMAAPTTPSVTKRGAPLNGTAIGAKADPNKARFVPREDTEDI